MSLFRDQVATDRAAALHGTINLAIPMGWSVITVALGVMVLVAVVFLASARYTKSEITDGSVVPSGGIQQVMPPRPGRVETISVREGQVVRKGQMLARIRVEQIDRAGEGTQTAILAALEQQQEGISNQADLARSASRAQQEEYGAVSLGLRQEIGDLDLQIAAQQKLVTLAREDLSRTAGIAARGFVSRRDMSLREEALLTREQQLSALRQARSAKLSLVAQNERARIRAAADSSGALAALSGNRAVIERDRATVKGDQGYTLVAPSDGRIAALDLHPGDAVDTTSPAMMIVPSGGALTARMYIPGKAAGFVRPGQPVRLALDAYPPERFGTIEGTISSVSAAPVLRADKSGGQAPYYLATAAMRDPTVQAYGRRQTLISGMTFSARIVTEQRTLLQWLFDPVLAATQR